MPVDGRYERQLAEAKAAAEALQALQDAKAKHERIELLHRQVRLMTTDDD